MKIVDAPGAFIRRNKVFKLVELSYTLTKLEEKYSPALDNYGQSCFVRSDYLKMKCVCKTQ